jgi:electron transfer flavoprotein alpha subunit
MNSRKRGDIWIMAETSRGGGISETAFELLARARPLADKLGSKVKALVMAAELSDMEAERLTRHGADEILILESPVFADFDVEPRAAILAEIAEKEKPEVLLASATYAGRALLPYAAAKLRAGLTADCVELDIDSDTGNLLQTRPAIGGNIMATIETPTARPQMATIRPNSTKIPKPDESRSGTIVRSAVPERIPLSATRHLGFEPAGECSLKNADTIVVIGRGIKKAERVARFAEFADSIGAALGATREVVDRGWLPYKHQIGLSGKTVSPKLYLSFGVSGAIQHLAGMRSSDTVVAVNTDADAPIFKVADFGIVGDMFDALDAFVKRFSQASPGEKP